MPAGDIFSSKGAALSEAEKEKIGFEEAARRAEELKLWEDPYWRTLLHYKGAFFCRYKSLVDDPDFFCAKNGKTNPKAELLATLWAFYEEKPENFTGGNVGAGAGGTDFVAEKNKGSGENADRADKAAAERFPGRYRWLCEKLGLSEKDFGYDGDVAYRALKEKANPGDIYLVFPSCYLKRPASVFGHTFLVMETKNKPRLTANSINYGAVTTLTGGPLYALLGLVGGFKGYYGFEAYYEKIKQYSDMDMRDMWEYRLNFNDDEKDRLFRHVCDLSGIYSRYFFMGENCSYNLLFLIEAARPSTKITEKTGGIVEPVETVKLVYDLGLTDRVDFRPSVYSKVENQIHGLSKAERKFAKAVCLGKKTPEDFPFGDASPERQAALWDLCADYLNVLLQGYKISQEEYRSRFLSVLSARRKLGKVQTQEFPVPPHPENAHGSKKVALEGGKDSRGGFVGANFRLTAHEQLEKSAGYSENSELAFAVVDLRYSLSENEFYLKKADLLSIISLPVTDSFFFNSASQLVTGLEQTRNRDGSESLAWRLKTMYGFSLSPLPKIQFYALGGVDLWFAPDYSYGNRIFAGGEAGFVGGAGPFRAKLYGDFMVKVLEADWWRANLGLQACLTLSQNLAFKTEAFMNMDWEDKKLECLAAFNLYF
ncbi:DUF4105 domain-containing protein [Treponema berlinense]|uniref:Lnb N-terminal periplasmic domain-containing protein n=1 Tax=Treponema berlinense TaxID=225004 RepID=UPI0026ECF15D|nr:DUF4105 domain-containing protein [Treponema berlinense]